LTLGANSTYWWTPHTWGWTVRPHCQVSRPPLRDLRRGPIDTLQLLLPKLGKNPERRIESRSTASPSVLTKSDDPARDLLTDFAKLDPGGIRTWGRTPRAAKNPRRPHSLGRRERSTSILGAR